DHLDFHRDLEDYFNAKALLFRDYPRSSQKAFTAVVNVDDPYGRRLGRSLALPGRSLAPPSAASSEGKVVTFGMGEEAELRASEVEASATALSYTLRAGSEMRRVRLRIGGRFNV